MKHRVITRLRAEADVTDAAIWYESRHAGLGHAFLAAVDAAVTTAAKNPFRFPRLRQRPEVRRVLTDRFPYRVFFIRRQDGAIVVFRVLHGAQHDREWRSTVREDAAEDT